MKNYYLLAISACFICGEISARVGFFRNTPQHFLIFFAASLFALLLLSLNRDKVFFSVLLALFILLGAFRYSMFNRIEPNHIRNYASYAQEEVILKGEIADDPARSPSGKKEVFTLKTDSIKLREKWESACGLVLVSAYGKKALDFQYGDIVILEGALRRPFAYRWRPNFDYRKYLENKRIYSALSVKKRSFAEKIGEDKSRPARIRRAIYSIRSRLEMRIREFLDPPYSSMLAAFLLGKRQGIPPWMKELFVTTGTIHVLAISGLHVGIIYFALRLVFKIFRIPRNTAVVLSVLFLAFFLVISGGRISIVRAVVMFTIIALGEILRRKISIFNLIGLSCLIILTASPNQLFDIGFILSYTAVLAIVVISPIFYRVFYGVGSGPANSSGAKIKQYTVKALSVSLAAWIGLLPLIAYYSGLISPIVVIANLVAVPLVSLIMGSGILFIFFGLLSKFLAAIFAESAWFFIVLLVGSVKFLEKIPFSYFQIRPPGVFSVILYYLVLISLLRIRSGVKIKSSMSV